MKFFNPDLRFTHDRQILVGLRNIEDNAVICYIGNYPTERILNRVDMYTKNLKPPNEMWDAVLNTGDPKEKGSGWASTGFESKYREYIINNDDAYEEAQMIRARAKVRPVYVGHHPRDEMYSPARVCIQTIENVVELPSERDGDDVSSVYEGWG